MVNQNLKKAAELFDSPEKWNAFVELKNISWAIENEWWKKFKQRILVEYRKISSEFPEWEFESDFERYPKWIEWRLKHSKDKYLSIYFQHGQIGIYPYFIDKNNIKNDLTNFNFTNLCNLIDNNALVIEDGNFCFNSEYDSNISADALARYAGNETEKLVEQVLNKVRIFFIPANAELFKKLAENCS